jgi:small-conductance mechanosensitive channel
MLKGFFWRTWFFGFVLILVCLFPSVRVGFCVSEDIALKETQRRMIEQTAHRLDQKEERLKSVEEAIKDRAGKIEHHLQELEALWERQHLILGVSKGDFFSSRDLYLINIHLQGIVESLIQGPQEELQCIGDDQAWTKKVLNKAGEYQQQYGPGWQGSDAKKVKALVDRIQGLQPRYLSALAAIEGEIRPVHAFLAFLKKRQEALVNAFQADPQNLFLKRGQNLLSVETWSNPAGQGKQWLYEMATYAEELFVVHAHLWIKLLGVAVLLSLFIYFVFLTVLRRLERRSNNPLGSGLRSPLVWFACGLGLFLAGPATGVPAFSLQGALIAFLLGRALLGLACWLRASSPDKTLEGARELKGLWGLSFAGILLSILAPPNLMFLFFWLLGLALLGLTIDRVRSSLSGTRLLIVLYVPIAAALSIFGWLYASISLALVLFVLLLNWQLALGLDERIRGQQTGEEKKEGGGAVHRIGASIGFRLVFAILGLLTLPWVLEYLGGPFLVTALLQYRIGWGHVSMEADRILLVLIGLLASKSAVGVVNEAIALRHEKKGGKDKGSIQALQTLIGYLIWVLFGMCALYLIGFTTGNIAVITGGLSVGVGFGLQNIIHNFVGGMILLFSRPIQPGDLIDHGGKFCRVRKVSIRNTVVETFDGKTIFIPNSDLISKEFSNWSHKDKRMRLKVDVGVSYNADPTFVKETLLSIAKSSEKVLQTPKPIAIFKEFGPSTLQFSLKFWIKGPGHLMAGSELRYKVYEVFKEKGIEIAYPQMDVHLDSKNAQEKAVNRDSMLAEALDGRIPA